ncbi:hypothetical protein CBER1_10761 [Cercospora berteroae]|uniref:Uncharacterized protein n=1 Tax=Cercospora berteroae TaxID=357750 RepID=A0A2S6CN74_9PEZI|nr:hypothetical protein CBER1_10761 [Cercospora berteroae]
MPVTWDDAKEKQLLLLIIHHTQPSPPWAQVAKDMGEGVSEEAVKQKLKKLKTAAKTQFGEPTSTDGAPPKTPAKRGLSKAVTETPAQPRSAAGKRKAKEVEHSTEEDDEDKAPAKKVKSEVEDGNGDD